MQKFRLRLLAVMLGMIPIATDAIADRAIPEDNLAYPVLIVFPGGTGSGFYLNANNAMYLVTAKHVLFYVDPISKKEKLRDGPVNALSYSKDRADSRRNILNLNLAALNAAGYIKSHATEDVAVIKVATILSQPVTDSPQQQKVEVLPPQNELPKVQPRTISLLFGITFQEMATGIVGVDVSQGIKTFDQVGIGNEVVMFGYPTSLALEPDPKIDFSRPLLRKEIVAGENPAQHSIILDCPSYQGDSGGPILEVERGFPQINYRIIGVMVSFVPFADTWQSERFPNLHNKTWQNSGYSVAVPMDFVLELIKE
jgi:Trypsin-like peptidase domain